jgi:hypothetical protein
MNRYKICKQCKVEKPLSERFYYIHKQSKDGFLNICIECKRGVSKNQWERIKSSPVLRQKEKDRQRNRKRKINA